MVTPLNSTHYAKLYPQNSERIVIIDYVTSFHRMYTNIVQDSRWFLHYKYAHCDVLRRGHMRRVTQNHLL